MPFVFGYGSLVDRASVAASIGRQLGPGQGPHPVRLRGFRRAWNVVGHTSIRPDYAFHGPDGTAWEGWLAFLGVEVSPGATTIGAACRLVEPEIALLDARERSYDRVDVAHLMDGELPGCADEPVWVYRPRADVVARARELGPAGTVMARYLRLVDRGYRALPADLYAEHLRTLPDPAPFVVREISAAPVVPGRRNEAVDPAQP